MSQIKDVTNIDTSNTYIYLESMDAARKKVVNFYGDFYHSQWDACIIKGIASYIGGRCVEATQGSYWEFNDKMVNYG